MGETADCWPEQLQPPPELSRPFPSWTSSFCPAQQEPIWLSDGPLLSAGRFTEVRRSPSEQRAKVVTSQGDAEPVPLIYCWPAGRELQSSSGCRTAARWSICSCWCPTPASVSALKGQASSLNRARPEELLHHVCKVKPSHHLPGLCGNL